MHIDKNIIIIEKLLGSTWENTQTPAVELRLMRIYPDNLAEQIRILVETVGHDVTVEIFLQSPLSFLSLSKPKALRKTIEICKRYLSPDEIKILMKKSISGFRLGDRSLEKAIQSLEPYLDQDQIKYIMLHNFLAFRNISPKRFAKVLSLLNDILSCEDLKVLLFHHLFEVAQTSREKLEASLSALKKNGIDSSGEIRQLVMDHFVAFASMDIARLQKNLDLLKEFAILAKVPQTPREFIKDMLKQSFVDVLRADPRKFNAILTMLKNRLPLELIADRLVVNFSDIARNASPHPEKAFETLERRGLSCEDIARLFKERGLWGLLMKAAGKKDPAAKACEPHLLTNPKNE